MENRKKQGFCIGALFLILKAVSLLFECLRGSFPYNIDEILLCIVLITVSVFLFVKKEDIVFAILMGACALFYLTQINIQRLLLGFQLLFRNFIGNFDLFMHVTMPEISDLLMACVWILITLIVLAKKELIPALSGKLLLLGKIFYPVAIVAMVFMVGQFNVDPLAIKIYRLLGREKILLNIFSVIITLLYGIGIILVGKRILPISEKKKKAQSDGAELNGGVSSEFYISMGKHICLMLFTFGIWLMMWVHKMTRFGNMAQGEEQKNPTTSLLLYLFVPFYSIYWTYKTAQRIDLIAKERTMTSDIGTVCLILAIFVGFIPPVLMQDKINSILTANQSPKTRLHNSIKDLEKYKELLDKGIITQEEFDTKKKQLLNL